MMIPLVAQPMPVRQRAVAPRRPASHATPRKQVILVDRNKPEYEQFRVYTRLVHQAKLIHAGTMTAAQVMAQLSPEQKKDLVHLYQSRYGKSIWAQR